jgi:PAS domain S-box-containing protein
LLIGTDNTARKQAEEALLKAGALQRAIFNSANFSSIATDAKGVIQIFNVGAERMLGYTAAEVMNKITPADISDPQEVIARAKALSVELGTSITPGFEALVFKASRGIEDIYELTYFRKDGSRFPAVVSVTALRDAQDAIIGYLLIGTDNTARKQAEEALLKAGALQRAIFNSANFSSIATDAKGVIQIFNVGAERMLGYTAAEVMNKITPADISDPQEVIARAKALSVELGTSITPGFEALVFKASRGIEDIYELTYFRKDGSRFPAVVSVTALRDAQDAIIGYLLIGTDNTARKQAEEAREQLIEQAEAAHRRLITVVEQSPLAISIAEAPSGRLVIANREAESIFGAALDSSVTNVSGGWRGFHADGRPLTAGEWPMERAIAGSQVIIGEVIEIERPDGARRRICVNSTSVRDPQGRVNAGVTICWDVTEQQKAEQELRNARLVAEAASRAKSEFLAVMSHELRTPLSAIIGYEALLFDGITGPVNERQRTQLGRIKASATYLLSLINEVLTLSRLEAGGEVAHSERIPLLAALRESVMLAESFATGKGLTLRVVPPPDGCEVWADPTKLRQILLNLLTNAIKFTDSGSVVLECGECEETVEIVVRDTGIGIAPADHDRVFDTFWQVEQKSTRKVGGTGLGLSVSRRLAHLMHGELTVASVLGEGSRFTLRLPAAGPDPAM